MLLEIERKDVSIKLEQTKNLIKNRVITIILLLFIIGFITAVSIFKDRQKKIVLTGIIKLKPESPNHVAKAIENSSEHFQNKDDVRLMEQVTQIIESNLENPKFKLSDLTEYVYLEERQLRTKIKMMTGLSPKKFQQEIILLKARKLLENETYGNVKAVAISVGMTHVTRFSRLYEARFGKHPSLYFKDAEFSIKKIA